MKLEKNMFVELDYTGRAEGKVFDTTVETVAKEAGLQQKQPYKPSIIVLGAGHLLPGLDEHLIGKELGTHACELPPEKAFGKKDAKLLKLIPLKKFKEAKIEPFRGLEVNIDNHYGIVRSVSGGRVTVDFNHPLAGRDVAYEVDVKRVVEEKAEQIGALVALVGLPNQGVKMEKEAAVITVETAPPQPVAEQMNSMIEKFTGVKTVTYHVEKRK